MMDYMDFDNARGLSQVSADLLLQKEGFNELPSQKTQSWFPAFVRILSEPMLLLLIIIGIIYLAIGEIKDALMLVFTIFVVVGITFYQERKTEKTLEALQRITSPMALVIRDGKQIRIPSRELVVGDLVVLREGDRVPADSTVLSCKNLSVDESLITGESVSVRKEAWEGKSVQQRPGGDDLPFVFSGSMVISGRGIIKITSTGTNTEIGKIGKSIELIKDEDTLLHKETQKIVRAVFIISLVLCIIVFLVFYLLRGDAVAGLLAGLTLSMALLPEEYPVILLVFLTLGAWRISKRKVLTRRPAVIETLGAATVLCVDKTGTLTQNRMQLAELYSGKELIQLHQSTVSKLSKNFQDLLQYAILSSQRDSFDPMEKELHKMGDKYLRDKSFSLSKWSLLREYPITGELRALSHLWEMPDKKTRIVGAKGGPEDILKLCRISGPEQKKIIQTVKEMSERGMRVLGVAGATVSSSKIPDTPQEFHFNYIGLLGFNDPIRSTAKKAVSDANDAGIRVIMITGDYPGTAQYIAKQIGIKNPDLYLTGVDLQTLSPQDLQERIKTINICARVFPEQKLLIVNALKANEQIVAMTGDGVNDAPAIKAAHIGISMGEMGTDVAREASSLVLLKDDFSSIVMAVRLGRRIFNNLKRAMGYVLAVHVPIAGIALFPLAFNYPAILLPAHIAFLELIIDPACSTVFESQKEDDQIMKRPPRDLFKPMLSRDVIVANLLQGAFVLGVVFVVFLISISFSNSETKTRTLVFVTLVLSNLMLIATNLSWKENIVQILGKKNRALLITIAGAILGLIVVIYTPLFSSLFRLTPLLLTDWAIATAGVTIALVCFELLKLLKKSNSFLRSLNLD